jgi:hypothetical protein
MVTLLFMCIFMLSFSCSNSFMFMFIFMFTVTFMFTFSSCSPSLSHSCSCPCSPQLINLSLLFALSSSFSRPNPSLYVSSSINPHCLSSHSYAVSSLCVSPSIFGLRLSCLSFRVCMCLSVFFTQTLLLCPSPLSFPSCLSSASLVLSLSAVSSHCLQLYSSVFCS